MAADIRERHDLLSIRELSGLFPSRGTASHPGDSFTLGSLTQDHVEHVPELATALPVKALGLCMYFPTAKEYDLTIDSDLLALREAATQADESAFSRRLRDVDMEKRSDKDWAQVIQLALAAGAHLEARRLAMQAADRFPQNAALRQYARVLAPPVNVARIAVQPGSALNMNWLRAHKETYLGKWVALREGELIDSAASLAELAARIGDPRDKGMMITRVC